MTQLSIKHGELIVEVVRGDALWALRSHLEIPLENIVGVVIDPSLALRAPVIGRGRQTDALGESVSRFVRVGDVYYWDITDPDHTITIVLSDVPSSRLVVQVENPAAAVDLIEVARRKAMVRQH